MSKRKNRIQSLNVMEFQLPMAFFTPIFRKELNHEPYESEKKLAYQIESTDQIGTLFELAMMNRYTRKSEIKEATESL
ncbi:hypothetical protein [Dielma fastidiosa]|uniref:hypothetical protein n=1 Tax=Dielma fastidiosa TaxID=1034346 RepID=UPI00356B3DFC